MTDTFIVIHHRDRNTGKMTKQQFSDVWVLAAFLKQHPQLAKDVEYEPRPKQIYPGEKRPKSKPGEPHAGM